MGTAVVEKAIVLTLPPEILGPGSVYDKRRIALKQEYESSIVKAKTITVVDSPEALEEANSLGRILQAGSKDWADFFVPIKRQIDAFKKPVLDAEKIFADELDREKRRLGGLITAFNQEQERKRIEAERQAREEAEKAAREEALQRAIDLEAAGDAEAANQILEEPVMAAPVVLQQEAPVKMAGQVGKTTYRCIVTDVRALLRAVAEGSAPMNCFAVDQGYLDRKAALDKEGFSLPGCKLDKQTATYFRS